MRCAVLTFGLALAAALLARVAKAQEAAVDAALQRWLEPQEWVRDTPGPIIALGQEG